MNMFTHDEAIESLARSAPKMKRIIMAHDVQDADADDIIQESLISADAHLDDRYGPNIESWFGSIAMNKMKDFFRRKARDETHFGIVFPLDAQGNVCLGDDIVLQIPEEDRTRCAKAISSEAIRYALDRLPPKPRAIFTLCYEDRLNWKEIAAALGMTDGAVRAMVFRHKDKFAYYLKEYYEKEMTL